MDGYHSTVDLMSTTTYVDLEAQLLLFWRVDVRCLWLGSKGRDSVVWPSGRVNSPTKQIAGIFPV